MDVINNLKYTVTTLPPITRLHCMLSVLLTIATSFGLISPYALLYNSSAIVQKGQVYRLFTSAFFPGSFFSLLFSFYFYKYTSAVLEFNQRFASKPGTFLQYTVVCQVIGAFIAALLFRTHSIHFYPIYRIALIYEWSTLYFDSLVTMYGFPIKGRYIPYVSILLEIFLGGNVKSTVVAFLIGIGLHNLMQNRIFTAIFECTNIFQAATKLIDRLTINCLNQLSLGLTRLIAIFTQSNGSATQPHTIYNGIPRKVGRRINE